MRLSTDRDDEIGDVMRNVDAMAESLQRMEGARRRWIADISHELRTPLSVLSGEVAAMLDGVRPTTWAAMGSLREEVLRLGALVEDLHLLAMADLNALPCRWAEAEPPRLFEPLWRADATRGRHAGGSGLGLAICEAIVRSREGTIRAARSPRGGLRIEVDLPRRPGRAGG